MKKDILLFSGGMDSTTLLYYLLEKSQKPFLFMVNYGAKHNNKENGIAIEIAKRMDLDYFLFKFDFAKISNSALTDYNKNIPNQKEDKQVTTVVPFRNTMFIVNAAAFVLSNFKHAHNVYEKDIYNIYISPVLDDYKSYRDCRPKFFKNLEKSLTLGSVFKNQIIKIHTPFIKQSKKKIVKLGLKLGVDYRMTWSCYNGHERPCLFCDACIERQEAFLSNGIKDPLLTNQEWNKFLLWRKK